MSNLDVLKATFPAGTLTGAPKIRAMELIDELEPVKRGVYGGACGYLSFAGDMDVAIAIRTGIVKDRTLYVQAAAGVVADSVPEAEWRETEAKAPRPDPRRRAGRGRVLAVALLVIDNYDSFTFNLVQDLGSLGEEVVVRAQRRDRRGRHRGDGAGGDRHLPGSVHAERGRRVDAGDRRVRGSPADPRRLPGHQSMGQALGGRVVRAARLMHGKTDVVLHDGRGVFAGLPEALTVMRYHSLAIERATLPAALEVTSTSSDGEIMGVRHRQLAATKTPLEGVQFHPESILTEHGRAMLRNFLELQ
jgi:anthranilate synthase component 2